jgi:serpin B
VHVVDFEGQPADAIDLINDWVDSETNGKITKLVDGQSVNNDTRFVLTNAIYFNAAWAEKFEPDSTEGRQLSPSRTARRSPCR